MATTKYVREVCRGHATGMVRTFLIDDLEVMDSKENHSRPGSCMVTFWVMTVITITEPF